MRILSKLLRITEDKDMVIHLPLRRIVNQNGKSFIYSYLPWKWINSAAISVFQHWHTTFPQPSDKSGKLKRDTQIQTLPRIICYASNLNAFHTLTLPPSRCVCVCVCPLYSVFWFDLNLIALTGQADPDESASHRPGRQANAPDQTGHVRLATARKTCANAAWVLIKVWICSTCRIRS